MKPSVPRTAVIHDLSCFGWAALTVVIPILSTMGIQVCPLLTAVFSTHGDFSGYKCIDTAIRTTVGHQYPLREGILLERTLSTLNAPIVSSRYGFLSQLSPPEVVVLADK